MVARRALLEPEVFGEDDTAPETLRQAPRRAIDAAVSFQADEPLTATLTLPRIAAPGKGSTRLTGRSVRLRRSLLAAAATATIGAALVGPSALSSVRAQESITQATPVTRSTDVSRDGERIALSTPTVQALADREGTALADASASASAARSAAEQKAAEEAAAQAAAEQKAAEDAAAQAAAEQKAAAEEAARQASAQASASSAQATQQASTDLASGTCSYGDGSNLGLTSQAQVAFQAICARFPGVTNYGGWRSSADDHGAGKAIDIMITGDAGWEIANWLVANSGTYNVEYVIYQQRIWGSWAPGAGFTWMEDRGSTTANHYDHVHVTIG